mgnify:CR=1 FL=1
MEAASTPATVRKLVVSLPKVGRIGILEFQPERRPTLILEGTGADVENLGKAWAEMSAQPKLKWIRSEIKEIDGRKVTQIRARQYAPDEPAYFYAVLDTLSRSYGYRVEIAN